jgi:hypothetical protein
MAFNSVSRLLSIWKGQGIVKLRRGIVEIHNIPHLLSCAELVHTSTQTAGLGNEVVAASATIVSINKKSQEGL